MYFFFEDGEFRENGSLRVTRVGTHAVTKGSKTTLWNRLSTHRGVLSSGGGNHRGSIFRLIIGAALIKRNELDVPSWGVGSSISEAAKKTGLTSDEIKLSEAPIEVFTSDYIGEMPFLWIEIPDEPSPNSIRAVIEQNSIALLSNYAREYENISSPNWLGDYSDWPKVKESRLWNNRHVEQDYDSQFLDILEKLIWS